MGLDLTMMRTPDQIPKQFPLLFRKSPSYFRGVPYEDLVAADLLDQDCDSAMRPDWPPIGLSKARANQLQSLFEAPDEEEQTPTLVEVAPTARELRVMQEWQSATDCARSARSRKRNKVPAYKFLSNDGWIVTPEESLILAYGLIKHLELEASLAATPKYVSQFCAFNQLAAWNGGYNVW